MTTNKRYQKPIYPPDWPVIAARIKQAHNWQCQICHIKQGEDPKNPITVHHLDHNTFNNEDSNLQVLCARHHLAKEREYRSRLRIDLQLNELQASGQQVLPLFFEALFPQSK